MIESELLSTKIFLAKVTPKTDEEKYLLLILGWKLIHGHGTKDSNGEKIIESFYEK